MNPRLLLRVTLAFLLAATPVPKPAWGAQQKPAQPTERDLKLERDVDRQPVANPPRPTVPRGYALIVGISNYKNLGPKQQLLYPESDARAVYERLISHEGGAFPAENVKHLLGKDATLANIREALEKWLPSVAKPTDRVIVFFAGHGFVAKNGRGYFAPWDVDPERLETTGYSMTRLGQVLANEVKAGWKVLLADACHSGKINPETTSEKLDAQFSGLPNDFLTLTATTERESSYEDPDLGGGFGLFSYFVTQALRGNADDDPCNGAITASELIEYVRTNVRTHAKTKGVSQTPTARGDYDPAMLLGVNATCIPTDGKTTLLGTAVIEVNMDNVDVYIDDNLAGRVSRGKPLVVKGLMSGIHVFRGCRQGYECDTKRITIAPGREVAVTLRVLYAVKNKASAIKLNEAGERLLFSVRSSRDPRNIIPVTRDQSEKDVKRAAALFEQAVADDPAFAKAFFNLGQARQLLGDQRGSLAAYRSALDIRPNDVDARIQYAAIFIESGDTDEAIRQLTQAERVDEQNDELYAMLAGAFWGKRAWSNAVESADNSLRLNASNALAQLWRADALRMIAADEKTSANDKPALYRNAREGYNEFIRLTNFSSSLGERLAFAFVGMGLGSRKHADRDAAFRSQRIGGFLGLCLTEQKVGNLLRAREYCNRGIRYDKDYPIGYFIRADVNRGLFYAGMDCTDLDATESDLKQVVKLNPNLVESDSARKVLRDISELRKDGWCSGRRK